MKLASIPFILTASLVGFVLFSPIFTWMIIKAPDNSHFTLFFWSRSWLLVMSTFQGSMLYDECRNSISNMVNFSLVPKVTMSYSSTEPAEEELPLSREEFCLGAVLCPAPALLTSAFFPYGPQP